MDSFAFPDRQQQLDREPVSKLRHNSRTKLRIKFSHVLERDNTVYTTCIASFRAELSACATKLNQP